MESLGLHLVIVGLHVHHQHSIAGLEGAHVAAHGAYYSADVLPKDGGQLQGEVLLPGAGADFPVDGINAGGRRLDQHRIIAHYRVWHIAFEGEFFRSTVFVNSDSFHKISRFQA